MSRFIATASFLLLLLLLLPGAPALAHGVGALESSNFASRITGLVAADAPGAGRGAQAPAAPIEGISWRVLGGDAYLAVTNRTEQELLVLGYELEPYLRIGPSGVFVNRRSPATHLNRERYPTAMPPATADSDAPPVWVRVSERPSHAWHDHRMQWMGGELPPAVRAAPDERHEVTTWVVPFDLGDRSLGVAGELVWVPPPSPVVWVALAVGLLLAPVAVAVGAGWHVGRVTGATLLLAALGAVVETADEVVSAVQASATDVAAATLPAVVAIVLAVVGGVSAWLRRDTSSVTLPVGALALAAVVGYPDADVLGASQMLSSLPAWLVRLLVATSLAAVAPAVVGAWSMHRAVGDDP